MSLDKPTDKLTVAILCGAQSAEHQVSLISAYNVVKAIDKEKYQIVVIGISKDGQWRQYAIDDFVENADKGVEHIKLSSRPISGRLAVTESSNQLYDLDNYRPAFTLDLVFPVIHGTHAEDGLLQGLLQMTGIPSVSASCLGSSISFDKDVSYRLLREAGLPVAPFIAIRDNQPYPSFEYLTNYLDTNIIFVKPANAGSSVGVSRVTNSDELLAALNLAFQFDKKVVIQAAVVGREVEVAVTGQFGAFETSLPGEITVNDPDDFYSYDNKYSSSDKVSLSVPAQLDPNLQQELQQASAKVCEVLECEGFGRVDFFVTKNNQYFVNEINTIPGFTSISMFPLLWQATGVDYRGIIDRVIELALARHHRKIQSI